MMNKYKLRSGHVHENAALPINVMVLPETNKSKNNILYMRRRNQSIYHKFVGCKIRIQDGNFFTQKNIWLGCSVTINGSARIVELWIADAVFSRWDDDIYQFCSCSSALLESIIYYGSFGSGDSNIRTAAAGWAATIFCLYNYGKRIFE